MKRILNSSFYSKSNFKNKKHKTLKLDSQNTRLTLFVGPFNVIPHLTLVNKGNMQTSRTNKIELNKSFEIKIKQISVVFDKFLIFHEQICLISYKCLFMSGTATLLIN